MVNVYNDWIYVSKDDPSYFTLSMVLVYHEEGRTVRKKNGHNIELPSVDHLLYTEEQDQMVIPSGIFFLIEKFLKESDVKIHRRESRITNTDNYVNNIDSYRDILGSIELRDVQLKAIKKILFAKRCIVQMSTGSGKTEVMCALTKILTLINDGIVPTILILVPTINLINNTYDRFTKYNIPIAKYSDNRCIINNCVNVCHPTSLGNDLNKDPELLSSIEVLIGDECHHFQSDTFRRPSYNMSNIVYSIGLSASAIRHEVVGSIDIKDYNYSELLIIGATGRLVMNANAGSLIDNGQLANPVLCVMDNPANEPISKNDIVNWSVISKIRLESDYRNRLIVSVSKFFYNKGRKTLILVRTKRWAHLLMELFDEVGMSDTVRASFGGGVFEKYDKGKFINDKDNVLERFSNGEYSVLIGTSHLYEGADLPYLDVLILGYGGKGERLQIQGLGRVLRVTKSGKYAWIIDFNDTEDIVLSKHSRLRMERYRDIINIPESHIFYNISINDLPEVFNKLEN